MIRQHDEGMKRRGDEILELENYSYSTGLYSIVTRQWPKAESSALGKGTGLSCGEVQGPG